MCMRPKKIILTVTNDLTFDQRMQKVSESLANGGWEVVLLGRKKRESKAFKPLLYSAFRIPCFFQKGKLFYMEFNLKLTWYLLTHSYDTVCSVDLDTILPGVIVSKIKGKKVIYDAHEYFTEVPEVYQRKKIKAVWEWVARFAIPKTDTCITVGYALAEIFEKKYNKKFNVILNTPKLEETQSTVSASIPKYILYQGALNKGRGIENMILAMHSIDIEFHIVGEGDLSHNLRELVEKEQLQNKVKFLGFMEPKELKTYSTNAFLGLNVSENLGLSYYYSLNNKFFDYIHAELPSLINPFPEYTNLLKRYKVGIECNSSPADLSKQTLLLLNNKELYNELKNNCKLAKQEWNWQNQEQNILTLYESK
jgi:glycosyltransferase involved in cell wall biosynthesis